MVVAVHMVAVGPIVANVLLVIFPHAILRISLGCRMLLLHLQVLHMVAAVEDKRRMVVDQVDPEEERHMAPDRTAEEVADLRSLGEEVVLDSPGEVAG